MRRIARKLRFLFLKRRLKSFDAFNNQAASGNIHHKLILQNQLLIQPYYKKYIQDISSANMAASLEVVSLMYTICKINNYKKILDLGSGLSSVVFRLYASKHPGVEVHSVDDSEEWLIKTKDFLSSYDFKIANISSLHEFIESKESGFDFIFYDMNFAEVRINHIKWLLGLIKTGGVIIIDDVHKPDYYFSLLEKIKEEPYDIFSLKKFTLDNFGRFSLAAIKR